MCILPQVDEEIEGDCVNFRREEGADSYKTQNVVIGSSNVDNASHLGIMLHQEEVPFYYVSKPGATIQELYKILQLICSSDEIKYDTLRDNVDDGPRPLRVLIWTPSNDIGRPYMDSAGVHLAHNLVKITDFLQKFAEETGREVKLAFTTLIYYVTHSDYFSCVDQWNEIIRRHNKNACYSETYDLNTILVKRPKPGEAGLVTIKKVAYVSPPEVVRKLEGTHLTEHFLAKIFGDLRTYFNSNFDSASPTPDEHLKLRIRFFDEPIANGRLIPEPPRWARAGNQKIYQDIVGASTDTETRETPSLGTAYADKARKPPTVPPRQDVDNRTPTGPRIRFAPSKPVARSLTFDRDGFQQVKRKKTKHETKIERNRRLTTKQATERAKQESDISNDLKADPRYASILSLTAKAARHTAKDQEGLLPSLSQLSTGQPKGAGETASKGEAQTKGASAEAEESAPAGKPGDWSSQMEKKDP